MKLTPDNLKELIDMVEKNEISSKQAKEVFLEVIKSDKTPSEVAKEKGMKQISDEGEIVRIANEVLDENPDIIEKYKNGRGNVVDYLTAHPTIARSTMLKEIEKR